MANSEKRQVSIFINGKEVENSIKGIKAEMAKVSNELARMAIGTDAYEAKVKDFQKLNGIVSEHTQKLRGVKQGLDGMKVGLGGLVGLAGGIFAADAIIGFGKELFNTGVQLDALDKKAKTVFGSTLPLVTAAAEKNATAMGLTTTEYVNASAAIADLLIPMGFQRTQAAEISTELVNLSGALSEWSGGQKSATEVSEILNKALLGEREELKSLGIAISEDDVKQRLRAEGLDKATGKTLEQAKATATLQLILEKSTDAQAAFADGSDSAIRRQAELSAKISDIVEKLSRLLLPVFETLAVVIGGAVNVMGNLVSGIEDIIDPAKAANDAFTEQAEKVQSLEKNTVPLLERYEELTTKTNLSKTEQDELRTVINKLAEAVPGAITQFNAYGEAIGINTDQVRALITAEQDRLKFNNEKAIKATQSKKEQIESEIKSIQNLLKVQGEYQQVISTRGEGYTTKFVRFTDEQISAAAKKLGELQTALSGSINQLAYLQGDNLKAPEPPPPPPKPPKGGDTTDPKSKKKTAEEIKAIEEEEFAQRYQRYAGMYQKLDELANAESAKAKERRALDSLDELNQTIATAEQKALIDLNFQAEKEAAQENVRTFLLTDQQAEIEQLQAHYFYLLQVAEQYGIDTTALKAKQQEELAAINKKYADDELNKLAEANQARAQALASSFQGLGDIVTATFDLLGGEGEKFANFQKVATLAKIAFDTASAISSLTAASSANPSNAVTFGAAGFAQFATGLARIIANIAQAKKILTAAPKVQQKYLGSYLNVTGESDGRRYSARTIATPNTGMLPQHPVLFNSNATGRPVLASERGAEYFVSAESLRNPYVADYVRMIDNISRTGRATQFAEGGSNTTSAPIAAPAPQIDLSALNGLKSTLDQLTAVLARGIQANISDRTIVDIGKKAATLSELSGGYF